MRIPVPFSQVLHAPHCAATGMMAKSSCVLCRQEGAVARKITRLVIPQKGAPPEVSNQVGGREQAVLLLCLGGQGVCCKEHLSWILTFPCPERPSECTRSIMDKDMMSQTARVLSLANALYALQEPTSTLMTFRWSKVCSTCLILEKAKQALMFS